MKEFFVHPTAIIEENVKIGRGTRIWHFVHVRENAEIGENCNIGKGVYIGSHVRIGNNVKIQNFVSVYRGVEIADDVFIGPHVTFTNDKYPRAFNREWEIIPTYVRKGVSVGAGSVVVCGVTLGEYCMVGAGSVVTKSIPPHGLVLGNPAKLVGYVCFKGHPMEKMESSDKYVTYRCKWCGEEIEVVLEKGEK